MQTIQMSLWVIGLLVALALLFDFMNGFHDAANSIATVVSTGVLKPHHAVAMAAPAHWWAAVFSRPWLLLSFRRCWASCSAR